MDVTASGRVLLERGVERLRVYGKLAGDAAERDLTYLDATLGVDLSQDGRRLLFLEKSPGVSGGEIFVRSGTAAPVHLGQRISGPAFAGRRAGDHGAVSRLFRNHGPPHGSRPSVQPSGRRSVRER